MSVAGPVGGRTAMRCGGHHPEGPGQLDERARRLSHQELAVARLLAAEGHHVTSLAESRTGGRSADLQVCGAAVEVKSFVPRAERGAAPTAQGVANKLRDAAGQAGIVVLSGAGSGLTRRVAEHGLLRYQFDRRDDRPRLDRVRIIGDGFDLSWRRERDRYLSTRPALERRGAGLSL